MHPDAPGRGPFELRYAMIPFALGGLFVYIVVLAVGLLLGWEWVPSAPRRILVEEALMLVCIPAALQALCGDVVGKVMRKRAFHPRGSPGFGVAGAGALAAILATGATAVAIPLLGERVRDALVMGASTLVCSLIVVACMSRVRAGRCVRCGYDLASSRDPARCPECGDVNPARAAITA